MGHLAAILSVDDNNLININMDKDQTTKDGHCDLKSSVSTSGKLLIASGESLKPEKGFFYLMAFAWNVDGKGFCKVNETKEELRLSVLLPDDSETVIEHMMVDVAK
jgi:hypothetical protein